MLKKKKNSRVSRFGIPYAFLMKRLIKKFRRNDFYGILLYEGTSFKIVLLEKLTKPIDSQTHV